MAVQRRVNWLSQSRVDVPDMRAVESAASNDWDQGIQALITNTTQGYILRGFEISMTGAIGGASSSLQMVMQDNDGNPAALLHIAASQSGTVLMVPPGTPSQQLNGATNSNVTGSFVPNALNYIGVDYTRFIDPTTDAQVYIWDPTTDSETSMTAPRAQILQFTLNISTSSWPSNLLPIAIVQTDAGNNVVTITDCRWLLFRLGTGGANPNPFFTYPWDAQPEGRTENPSSSSSNSVNPFEGGDKMLFSMKDWMNAVMTSLLEINGGTYWYSEGSAGSISKLREDLGNTFTAGNGTITHGVLPNSDPLLNTTASITQNSTTMTLASTVGLTNGETYFAFATGLPYATSFLYSGSATVTLNKESTITNATAALAVYIQASVTAPGQINWSDPFYLKVVGSNLSYAFAANPSSADILLADDQVAYITLIRDASITPNLFYTYNSVPNTTTVVSIGSVAWTAPLVAGDYLRAAGDTDAFYTQIQSVDSTIQVTLFGNYVPSGQTSTGLQSVYAFGSYSTAATPSTTRNIYIADRPDVPPGQDVWWLFSREDLGGVTPTVYARFIGTLLGYGDADQIDSGVPKTLLQYIGSPSESVSTPEYVSAINPGSVQQIISITTGDASTVAANQYFVIYPSNATRSYYVWIKKDGAGTDPMPIANAIGLEWDVTTGQTSAQLAASLVTLLNGTFFGDFDAVAASNIVTVTNTSAGESGTSENISIGAPFAITITQVGTGQGNYVITDGDNLTVAIKKLDNQIASLASAAIGPGYDETVDVIAGSSILLQQTSVDTDILYDFNIGDTAANNQMGIWFVAPSNTTITGILFSVGNNIGLDVTVTGQVYIYADNGSGQPGTLLQTSPLQTMNVTGVPQSFTFTFNSPVAITSGSTYHITLGVNNTSPTVHAFLYGSSAEVQNASGNTRTINGGVVWTITSLTGGLDPYYQLFTTGVSPGPSDIIGPVAPGTEIQLPPNSRNSDIQVFYEVGAGKLEVFLNGQKLVVDVDYTEVGASGSSSEFIANTYQLDIGDQLEFTFGGGGGGGGGGGEQGPPGPAGPAGPAGVPGTGPVNISTINGNLSPTTSQNTILANCMSNAITVTLPTPSSSTGFLFYIKKTDATTNALTITVAGGANIDGAPSQSTTVQYYAWTVICDGTQYWLF